VNDLERHEEGEANAEVEEDHAAGAVVPAEDLPRLAEELQPFLLSFSGPMPPPAMLGQYEQILPGFAERTLALAEQNAAHGIEMEEVQVTTAARLAGRGQIFAFVLALISILAGVGLIAAGKSAYGLAAILTPLGSVLIVFVVNELRSETSDHRQGNSGETQTEKPSDPSLVQPPRRGAGRSG